MVDYFGGPAACLEGVVSIVTVHGVRHYNRLILKKEKERHIVMERQVLIVRLLPKVDEKLRALVRFHGDLSVVIEEAIAAAELETLQLVQLGGRPSRHGVAKEKVVAATSASVSVATVEIIEKAAAKRGKSKNVIVNSALLWWLEHSSHAMLRR